MARMRVLQVNLHLTTEGCLVAVQEVHWKGACKNTTLLQRQFVEGPGITASPAEVLAAVAELFELTDAPGQEGSSTG